MGVLTRAADRAVFELRGVVDGGESSLGDGVADFDRLGDVVSTVHDAKHRTHHDSLIKTDVV